MAGVGAPLALSKVVGPFLSAFIMTGIPLPHGGKDICAGETYQAMGEVRVSAELLARELSSGLV